MKRTLKSVRWLFGAGALVYLAALILVVWVAGQRPEAMSAIEWLVVGMLATLTLIAAVASWRIYREPLLWCLLLASFNTLDLALDLSRELSFKPVSVVWTLALWAVVLQVARVRVHILAYPEAWTGEHRQGRREALPELLGERASVRERDQRRLRARRAAAWKLTGGVLAALLVAWGAWAWVTRTPPIDPVLDEFRAAWSESRLDGVSAHFASERMSRSFARAVERRWESAWPPLGQPRVEPVDEERSVVRFFCEDGELRTSWELRADVWRVTQVRFPQDD